MTAATARGSRSQGRAALAMYDPPELHAANDALWQALRRQLARDGVEAPESLTRDVDLDEVWRDPDLLLAQTCGQPLVTRLRGIVQLVAVPRYAAPGCAGAFHRSAIVVGAGSTARRLDDLRGLRCAINDPESNSGANLLQSEIAPLAHDGRFFGQIVETGSHAASLDAVAAGRVDVAAIDCVTLAFLARHKPEVVAETRVLQWTALSAGLPLVTSGGTPPATVLALQRALAAVADDPALEDVRRALLITGFSTLSASVYDPILARRETARARGYPVLA